MEDTTLSLRFPAMTPPAPAARRRPRGSRPFLAALVGAGLVVLSACGGGSSGPKVASAGGAKSSTPARTADLGIANVMVISVLERRSEIGLRRALGATRAHVGAQFITESLLLASIGGMGGAALGAVVTVAYATSQSWTVVVPAIAVWAALGASISVGVVAGLYPALRAARLAPTDALRTA